MKINSFSGNFSVHAKRIILLINQEEHNISELFPKNNYSHEQLNNPEINWRVRCEMCEIIRNYVKNIDPEFPSIYIIC